MQILEIGPGKHPNPQATIRIDIVENPLADYVMSAERLKFKDNSFDSILMFECLEHMEQPLTALREIYRVLKPGGRLVFSIPNVYYYRLFLRWFWRGRVTASNEHLWNWSAWEITKLCEKADFYVERIEPYNEEWNNKKSVFYPIFPRVASHSIKINAIKK